MAAEPEQKTIEEGGFAIICLPLKDDELLACWRYTEETKIENLGHKMPVLSLYKF